MRWLFDLGRPGAKARKLSPAQFGLVAVIVALVLGLVVEAMNGPEPEAAPEARQRLDALVAKFEQVAFHPEGGAADPLERVGKWNARLRIGLDADAAGYRALVARHAAVLAELTGLDVALLEAPGARANLRVRLVGAGAPLEGLAAGLAAQLDAEGCASALTPSDGGVITEALVLIRAGLDRRRTRSCLVEELTQSLGLPGHSALLPPSIFADGERYLGRLSLNDRLLVETLYDPRIRPGMARQFALDAARDILAARLRESTATSALGP